MVSRKNQRKLEKKLRNRLLHIVYHGTTKENADKILKEGFKPWTYFAKNLAEALYYGGGYVFAVAIEHNKSPEWFENWLGWQIMNHEHIPITQIVNLRKYSREEIFTNKPLWNEVGRRGIEYYNKVEKYGK